MKVRLSQMAYVFSIAFVIGLGLMACLQFTLDVRYWPLGVDVYPTWNGTRAMLQGQNPYSAPVQLETQRLIYGRPSQPDEDSFWFYYPPYIAAITLPLVLLPVKGAAFIWTGLLCGLLLTLVVVWAWNIKPRPAPWLFGSILFSGILFRPAATSVINGQYALFIVACSALALWLIERRQDFTAGVFVAFITFKPSVALLAPVVLLVWAARYQRWRLVIGCNAAMFFFLALPMLRIGWWIPDFFTQMLAFTEMHRGEGLALAWLPEETVTVGGIVWLLGTLVLLGIGVVRLWHTDEFPWLAILGALNLNLILTPHLVEYDLVTLLIPLLWLGGTWLGSRWRVWGWMILVWIPWLSWLTVMMSGSSIDLWWRGIWLFYPSLLNGVILLSMARPRVQQFVSRLP